MKVLVGLVLLGILWVLCWPAAILILLLWPVVWLLAIPFRIVGMLVEGLLALVKGIVLLPGRMLGCRVR